MKRIPEILAGLAVALVALLFFHPAHAAQGVNAVAMFYANGTYRMVAWDEIDTLNRRDRRYVCATVFHVQTTGDWPNAVTFCGAEELAIRRTAQALIVREFFAPNGREVHKFFEDDPVQTIGEAWADSNAGFFAAVQVHILSRAFGGPYNDLTSRAASKALSLRFDPVPSSGDY